METGAIIGSTIALLIMDKVFIAVCDPRIYDKKNASFLYFIESMSVPHKMQKKKW